MVESTLRWQSAEIPASVRRGISRSHLALDGRINVWALANPVDDDVLALLENFEDLTL